MPDSHARFRSSLLRRILVAAFLGLACLLAFAGAARATTVVSLTFDDGSATEFQAGKVLRDHGMHGTFYLNSSQIGTSDYYMTWANVSDLAADGNEIGGHTAHHANLPLIDSTEAQRQICQDRVNLINRGFAPRNFAYPYGAFDANTKQLVQSCGYNSARTTAPMPSGETIPPADPYEVHQISGSGDLTTLKNAVTNVEQAGGGWATITFHQICNACDTNWILPSDFKAFLDWLEPRAASGTVVQRVQDVIGGPLQPAVAPAPAPPAANGFNGLRNPSLETDADGDQLPDCWTADGYGNNTFAWTRTFQAHSGTYAERVTVTNYSSGDNKLRVASDLGFCTPSVIPGHRYRLTAWYNSDAPVSFTAFSRDNAGSFQFWASSAQFAASPVWTQASWVTPVVPANTTGLSFGLALTSNGTLTVDDLGIDDSAPTGGPDTTPPTVSLTSPSAGATVAGTVPIAVSASDNVAVDHVDFLVDGAPVGSRSLSPYTLNWNSRSVANGSHTIVARAYDTAGSSATTATITVLVANSLTNLLQNPSLETASGSTPTCWTLGGYGTNTFAWTRTSDAHSGSFAEKLDITSRTDGDRKMVVTQSGTTCPVSATPGHSYNVSAWYKSPGDPNPSGSRPVLFAYYRNSAGSWVYWTQSPNQVASTTWRQATWNTPNLPAGATALSVGLGLQMTGTVTMDDLSIADNAPPPDTTAPTSTITCNDASDNAGCISGYYNDTVGVSLSASDGAFGSGIASIRYTTDGSTPTPSNGSTYMGAFAITSPGATVKWRAYDNAGNGEAVHSQTILIDPTPPQSAISCDSGTCGSGFYGHAVSASLSATDSGGSDLRDIVYTTDGSTPTITNGTAYLGPFSLPATTTVKYRAYDHAGNAEAVNTALVQIDTVAPTSLIACNGSPCTSQTYTSAVSVTFEASDGSGGSGVAEIRYTTDGSDPNASNGTVYSSLSPPTLNETTTVKSRAIDNAGNLEPVNTHVINVNTGPPPSVTLTSPVDGASLSGTVTLTADATNAAITSVEFLVGGSTVGTSTSPPYETSWDSTTVADGPHTVTARGLDENGAILDSDSASVTVNNVTDETPPTSTISCNATACSTEPYNAAVSISLDATDNAGGTGVREIRYTTDGSTPTSDYGTVYSGTFSVTSSTAIKYRAVDHAGNAEPVNTQSVTIDSVAPASSIFCNGIACSSGFYSGVVSVSLAASDGGGSGVQKIVYTTDGSTPSSSNGTEFDTAFSLSTTTTVKYRAWDNAGNVEPVNSALIRVDTTPPSSSIACGGSACTGPYASAVSVTLSATDDNSGVASIRYTTNGSDPTASSGTVYSGAFSVSSTTTVKYRAFDNVANAEAVQSKLIQIDSTPPSASLTNPAAGDLLAGTVNLTATASDNIAVDHVDFLVDGQQVGSDSSAPYAFAWNSASVADGPHTIAARAADGAGNTTTSSSVSVTNTNTNLLQNPSLETASGSTPTCWLLGGYGTNTFAWTRTSDAHSGSFGEKLDITSLSNGDRKIVSVQDAGACAPSVTAGKTYLVSTWYKSASSPTLFAYYRNSSGWVYWTQSPSFPTATSWTRRTWITPAVPSGATALSIGPGLKNTGSLTVDDLGLFANG